MTNQLFREYVVEGNVSGNTLEVDASNHTPSRNGSAPKSLPIAIINRQLLSSECLARAICSSSDLQVLSFSTLDDWLHRQVPVSLLVLCQTRLTQAEAMKEIERLTDLSAQSIKCPAVILSDNEDPDLIVRMLGRNIRGYIPTSLPIDIVIQAMELARAGGVYVPASSLIAAHRVQEDPSAAIHKPNGMFTVRQAAVVEALRRGKANKIIAYELNMRESTVKVHVRNIMKKLHATNRTEVAYLASRLLNGEDVVR
jgi:DNA-binding NarL/FixJ family response regulator